LRTSVILNTESGSAMRAQPANLTCTCKSPSVFVSVCVSVCVCVC
jgi:hypothetical protein